MLKHIIAAAALGSVLPTFAATNLILDYGFEQVSVPAGQAAYYTGAQLTGWTATSGSIEVRDNFVGKAQEGKNFVELDSTANSSMSTTFTSVLNQVYTLSFWYSGRPTSVAENGPYANTVVPSSTMGLSYSVGAASGNLFAPANATADNIWQQYSTTFTGTGGIMTLSLAATGTSDSYGASLDNVSVTANPQAVPEPASVAMMAAGLLGLMGLGLRRRGR